MNTKTLLQSYTSIFLLLLTIVGCQKDAPIPPGNDPNFKIVPHSDAGFSKFNRKVDVFGISIYAVKKVADTKLLHAANLMAQYLDNDEDGTVDNPAVWNAMLQSKAYLVMWKRQSDLNGLPNSPGQIGQDLGNDETVPAWHTNGHLGQFDAAVEEVWHLVTHAGYEQAYPAVFGTQRGSSISNAMDAARGGDFNTPPANYPEHAWYTYNDPTCDYTCQGGEYIYWLMSSILGAQENRQAEISNEWDLHTPALVASRDSVAHALLTDPQYHFPTVLPDGTYRH